LYFTLIRYQQSRLALWETQRTAANGKLSEILDTVKNSDQIDADLLIVSNKLAAREADMPSGDLYASLYDTLRKFKAGRKVDIPQLSSEGTETDMNMLPKFPYKQVLGTIVGTAYYHDLGKFIADYENEFPTSRVLSLDISPAAMQSPDEKDKLAFTMSIASLVKSSGAPETKTTKKKS
jgi:hypothetical protein